MATRHGVTERHLPYGITKCYACHPTHINPSQTIRC